MRRRFGWWIGASLLLSAAAAWAVARPDLAAQAGAGVAAHNLCSASFVAGLDPDTTFRELVRLHQHVHLENNILFPRAVELETPYQCQ
jgi:hypothetical protein